MLVGLPLVVRGMIRWPSAFLSSLWRQTSVEDSRSRMCVRCLKEGMFLPGLIRKRSRVAAIPSAAGPVTAQSTPLSLSEGNVARAAIVAVEPLGPSETYKGRDFLFSPLFVLNVTLCTTSLIFNLLQSTE